MSNRLPSYDELPYKPGNPPRTAWGLWGDDDQIGTINLLTPERVTGAAKLVRKGSTFPMNWDLEKPNPPQFFRQVLRHTITRPGGIGHDDIYDNFNTQSSTQWDGLRHVGHPDYGYYNGVPPERINHEPGTPNGIEHWARRGIAGRGVLVDFAHWAKANGVRAEPNTAYPISAAQMQEAAKAQGVTFETGDILLFRTGWIEWYDSLTARQQFELGHDTAWRGIGLEQSDAMLRFLWDNHFAAVATDCPSFEVSPAATFGGIHKILIPLFGLPLGELFNLDPLAADCAADHTYEFFFTSAPLNKLGGIASPPNALAIK